MLNLDSGGRWGPRRVPDKFKNLKNTDAPLVFFTLFRIVKIFEFFGDPSLHWTHCRKFEEVDEIEEFEEYQGRNCILQILRILQICWGPFAPLPDLDLKHGSVHSLLLVPTLENRNLGDNCAPVSEAKARAVPPWQNAGIAVLHVSV